MLHKIIVSDNPNYKISSHIKPDFDLHFLFTLVNKLMPCNKPSRIRDKEHTCNNDYVLKTCCR